MAIRYAVASGNWSNVATWNGGATLPGVGDIVHADGKSVTIDQNITVESIRTTVRSGGTTGGGFILNNPYNITANIIKGQSALPALDINISNNSVTLIGDIVSDTSTWSGNSTVKNNSNCNIIIIGNLTAGYNVNGSALRNMSTGNITVTGNLYGGIGDSGYYTNAIRNESTGSINVTGNVYGGTPSGSGSKADCAAIYGGAAANIINIVGNIIPSTTSFAIWLSSTLPSIVTVTGDISSSINCSAIVDSKFSSELRHSGNLLSSTHGVNPIIFFKYKITDSNPYQSTIGTILGNTRVLMTSNASPYLPSISDVRKDVIFGVNNDLVGTLAVPPASSVVAGVHVDNTTGTFGFTPELITRLQNCATVESTGEQLEALIN